MPIRIARVITRLNVGGPSRHAVNVSAGLEERGYHTLLLHGRVGESEGDMGFLLPADRAFETEYVPSLGREIAPAHDAAAFARLFRALRRFRPAIVHTHMAKAGSLGRVAAMAYNATVARRDRARILHTYHGHVLDGYFGAATARAFSAVERTLGRRSDALLAVSPAVHRDLLDAHRIGSADTLHVVPLGLDLARFAENGPDQRRSARASFGVPADAHVVAFVGRLTAIKQPERFLEAAGHIAHADPRARFLVAGGGDLERATRAAAAGLGDRVTFLGWQQDVASVYAAADVLALTSRNEGTPVALIESMAAGVPGVAFAVGGVPDVIARPDLGVLVGEGDTRALASAIVDLLRDDARRLAMGVRARADVVERYSVRRLLHDLDTLYRRLL